jgi:Flp pilus assembly protein TadB
MKIVLAPICLFLMFELRSRPILGLALVFLAHFLPLVLMMWNQKSRLARFRRQILPFLDELLLKMRSGRSLRESLSEVGAQGHAYKGTDLAELSILVCFPERKSDPKLIPQARELLSELLKIDQSASRTIEKVRAYRKKEKMVQKFRQKSSQVTGQVRAQAIVCAFLYVALLAWVVWDNPDGALSLPVVVSFLLFLVGMISMSLLARSFRWKL